jgi:hypothetical protein
VRLGSSLLALDSLHLGMFLTPRSSI